MGRVKTVVMGDSQTLEKARQKREAKRQLKKAAEKVSLESKSQLEKSEKLAESTKTDLLKSQEILKRMATEIAEPAGKETQATPKKEVSPKKKALKAPTAGSLPAHGKKYREALTKVDKTKLYPVSEALDLVKKTSFSSFDGSIEAHINVSGKGLRGSVDLPHGTGKTVRVRIADDQLISDLEHSGKIDFDILVAHPTMMAKLAKVAKILGPRGLMPNPKTGTIGDNPEELAKKLSAGQLNWKTEANFPIVHTVIGKVSYDNGKLEENYLALAKSIGKVNIKSAFLKATMGPNVKVTT